MRPRITVAGGANGDLVGIPDGGFVPRDSNPGHVKVSAGGVGRNIAENLARLGADVRLVTAFGDDDGAASLAEGCTAVGIDVRHSIRAIGTPCSRYLAVLDEAGDLAAAVNDMRALEALTPTRLDPAAFEGAEVVVLDCNLSPDTLVRAVELAGTTPVVLDPVSVPKAAGALPVLEGLTALKANVKEAEALTGTTGAEAAADRLLRAGVRRAFISLGPDGLWCASAEGSFAVPAVPSAVANVTGAGDALAAGIAWGIATGLGMRETALAGVVLAAIALESERTVSERVSLEALRSRMKEAQA